MVLMIEVLIPVYPFPLQENKIVYIGTIRINVDPMKMVKCCSKQGKKKVRSTNFSLI